MAFTNKRFPTQWERIGARNRYLNDPTLEPVGGEYPTTTTPNTPGLGTDGPRGPEGSLPEGPRTPVGPGNPGGTIPSGPLTPEGCGPCEKQVVVERYGKYFYECQPVTCPPGTYLDPYTCDCLGAPCLPMDCGPGTFWDQNQCRCISAPCLPVDCGPGFTWVQSRCECISDKPECPKLSDFGRVLAPAGEKYRDSINKMLGQGTGTRFAQLNEAFKSEFISRMSSADPNSDYRFECTNYTIYEFLCSDINVRYTRVPGSNHVVAKFAITSLADVYYVTDGGRLCKLVPAPKGSTPKVPKGETPKEKEYEKPHGDPTLPPYNNPGTDDLPPPTGGPLYPPGRPVPPGGPLGSGKIFTRIPLDDMIKNRQECITRGLWSGNVGNLLTFHTCSTQHTASGRSHYVIYSKKCDACAAYPEFDIAYGHDEGSGSVDLGGFDDETPSNAIYGQYRGLCLEANEKRFTIGDKKAHHIYVINVRKDRMKDKLDEGNIEINLAHLSGSEFIAGGGPASAHTGSNVKLSGTGRVLRLIDDSKINPATITSAGSIYNVVSGSIEDGVYNSSNPHIYGQLYTQLGVIVLDADRLDLSASFATVETVETNGDNAMKLFTAMSGAALLTDASGDKLGFQARHKDIQYNSYYFVRVKNSDYNFTNNPTYTTGSEGMISAKLVGHEKVYITQIGLYNDRKELLAVGKISKPKLKSCTSEALFCVNLRY